MVAEKQTINARHGVATFVPAGSVLRVINTSGTQVIDTWAFALPTPEAKNTPEGQEKKEEEQPKQDSEQKEEKSEKGEEKKPAQKPTPRKKKGDDFPSQEDAEKATQNLLGQDKPDGPDAKQQTPQKSTWSSYVPTLGLTGSSKKDAPKKDETEQQKNSRTWSSYFPSGKGFSNYIPKSASDTVSAFSKDVSSSNDVGSTDRLTECAAPTRSQQVLSRATSRLLQNPRRRSGLVR